VYVQRFKLARLPAFVAFVLFPLFLFFSVSTAAASVSRWAETPTTKRLSNGAGLYRKKERKREVWSRQSACRDALHVRTPAHALQWT
jgi:hypothetical protein